LHSGATGATEREMVAHQDGLHAVAGAAAAFQKQAVTA